MFHRSIAIGLTAWLVCAAHAQLTYIEQSAGLHTPEMETGYTEFEFGDVNHDGHIDLVSIGDHGSPGFNSEQHGVMVWFGDSAGNWAVEQFGEFGYGGVALGDVNADGWLDVGYAMHHNYSGVDLGDQLIEVALGDGSGQLWTPWDDGLATTGEDWGMFGTDFADVDHDNDLDLVATSFGGSNGARVYLNNSDGTWTHSFTTTGNACSLWVHFGELNGDGHPDFIVAYGNNTVYLGDGLGGFTSGDAGLPGAGGRAGISLGDVNADGRDDLAWVTSTGGLQVFSWTGPGQWTDLSGNLPTTGGYDLTQLADMNLDGYADLVAFASGSSDTPGLVRVFASNGAGNWTVAASITTADNHAAHSLRAGVDADHNGMPDLFFVQEEEVYVPPFFYFDKNRPYFYAESSTPDANWIYPLSPRGHETLIAGSVVFVDWTAAVVAGPVPTVSLELSLAGVGGPWIPLAADLPNNGRFQWHLDADLPTSPHCRLRHSMPDAAALTSMDFTIVGEVVLGDGTADGIVDTADVPVFFDCLAGPENSIGNDSCRVYDYDLQSDVDLVDYAAFQRTCMQ